MGLVKFIRDRIWAELPATVTPRQRKQAALAWGLALILLGAWKGWQHRHGGVPIGVSPIVTVLAGLILAGLLLLPALGSAVYLNLMRVVSIVGYVMSNLLLVLTFYLLITPMSALLRLTGKDFLETQKAHVPAWKGHEDHNERRRYYRLF